jgi:hypothetical protein
MHRTLARFNPHLLQKLSQESTPRLLLDPETSGARAFQAIKGAWAVVTSQEARDLYIEQNQNGILKESMIGQSNMGSALLFSLFENLRNPYWKDQVNLTDFVAAVGPAIENAYDISERLRNDIYKSEEERRDVQELDKLTPEEQVQRIMSSKEDDVTAALFGPNRWKDQAKQDADSLPGMFEKMTTPQFFNASYYVAKIKALGYALTTGEYMMYTGCHVRDWALLSARAQVIESESVEEHDELRTADKMSETPQVAAQIDVLCEISVTYKIENEKSSEKAMQENITGMTVAVLEGWLSGGPSKKLEWRLAQMRPAHEMPNPPTIVRTPVE